jgi:hypothetical protein
MTTGNYLLMLGVGSVFALALAFITHAGHAYLAIWPDLYWNWQLRASREAGGRFNWADYDDEGFWEFASLRNYLLYALTNLAAVWGVGLWFWDRKAYALGQVCAFVAHAGITPLFCP